ncbi:MAG: acyl-CoA dehydrogenase family protein, partial [Mycolicibacterium aromaticivorans]|nr:acyl-CoA dehydrogenase family protein [Mycolicibacterium aromaticivorans]
MNFDLTDEQELLRDTAREVFTRTYDIETRNKTVDSELGWSREVWRQLAEIGILGLGFEPEESGQIEIIVVMTELGRRLAPEPVAAAALIPGGLIAELGSDSQRAQLDDVAAGERLLALAHTEKGLRGLDELSTRATKTGDSWTIT